MSTALPAIALAALPGTLATRLEQHAHAARGAYADETARALRKASAAWTAWAAQQSVAALPALPATVAAYVDTLAAQGRAPASIRQAVWGVAAMHRAAEVEDPTKAEIVRLALKRMSKAGTRQRQAAPFLDDDARAAIRTAGAAPPLAVLRDLALALVMRDLLARRGEAVALQVEDVTKGRDGSATVLIARSKTDQAGAGEVRWLSPRTTAHLFRWIEAAGIKEGPIFRAVNKGGRVGGQLTGGDVPRILRKVAALAGIEATGISGHSCRVGMAQDLAASGAELPELMQAGRWKSPTMPARYTERQAAERGAVARFYAERVRA